MDQETEQSIKVLKTLRYSSHVHTVLVFDTISKLETGVRFALPSGQVKHLENVQIGVPSRV